jgi:hypothetical protein
VSFQTKRNVLKCYTHFKRDRPDLSNDAIIRGKVKTKHDITWFAQKTNVDQLNPATYMTVAESKIEKRFSFVYAIQGVRTVRGMF